MSHINGLLHITNLKGAFKHQIYDDFQQHFLNQPRGVQCIKHVRVYLSAHEGV